MAKTTKGNAKQESADRTSGDSLRWALGLTLFFVGVFAFVSGLFYLRDWQNDYSVLQALSGGAEDVGRSVSNPCGYMGAWLAQQMIANSFGLFGLLIPIMVMMLGIRIVRRKFVFNHAMLSMLIIMLLGSVTLGYTGWELFNTSAGGDFGRLLVDKIAPPLGAVGVPVLLVVAWILLGVFINRNFINTVNSWGRKIAEPVDSVLNRINNTEKSDEKQSPEELPTEQESDEQRVPATPPIPTIESAMTVEQEVDREKTVVLPPREVPQTEPLLREVTSSESEEPSQPVVESSRVRDTRPSDYDQIREVSIDELEIGIRDMEYSRPKTMRREPEVDDLPQFVEVPIDPVEESEPIYGDIPEDEFDTTPFGVEDGVGLVERPIDEPASEPEELPSEPQAPMHEGLVVTFTQNEVKIVSEDSIPTETYDPLKDLVHYAKPSPGLLENYPSSAKVTDEEIFRKKSKIEETLLNFGIPIKSINATSGPTVTLYEIRQADGVKISKIQGLENDIAQSIEARGIRIIAPIPGKGTIGIEVPNENKQIVPMYSSICSPEFQNAKMELPIVIGRTIQNTNFVFDLAKAPHLLVAGATGQGKSVGLNAIITSLLYTKHPAELKFVMIDPKMVEFSTYAGLERHFLAKMESEDDAIITDPKKAVYTLHALEQEMSERLQLCKKAGARNIVEYNSKFVARRLPPPKGHRFLPYIVVVIDEFADLIMTAKEVERPVMRLAQKARAVGIHLIIATQRPDVRVITGGIKANFPARIAFRVMQMVDSRTIIDQPGAQTLIGRGDMLFTNGGELTRVQCAFVDTPEVERIVEYISKQQGYPSAYPLPDYTPDSGDGDFGGAGGDMESGKAMKVDSKFAEIARAAVEHGSITVSMIQRNYEVGFNRAGRIVSQLQQAGVVGPQIGAKPRDVLIHDMPTLEAKLQDMGLF